MQNNNLKYFLFLIIIITISSCSNKNEIPPIVHGKIDLSEWDFAEKGNIKLDGEWEFYPNQLLTPEDFKGNEPINGVKFVKVPAKKPIYKNNTSFHETGFATYRLLIKIKNSNDLYAIESDYIYTSAKIWANSQEVATIGRVGENKKNTISKYSFNYYPFSVDNNNDSINYIQLIVQVSDFVASNKFGITKSVIFGTYKTIFNKNNTEKILFFIFLGILIITALYRISLYFLLKKESSILFFSIFIIVAAIHGFFSNTIYLPEINFMLAQKILYLTAVLFPSLLTTFFYYNYKKEYNKNFLIWLGIISIILGLFIIIFPCHFFMKYVILLLLFIFLTYIYNFVLLIKAIQKKRIGAIISIIGLLIIILTVINDALFNIRVINTEYISFYGLTIFVIMYSIVISKRFSSMFFNNIQLSSELNYQKEHLADLVKERTEEISKKNEILKQQTEDYKAQAAELEIVTHELEKLSIIARETDNAVIIYNKNFDIIWVNHGFERLYNSTYSDYVEDNVFNLIKDSNYINIQTIIDEALNKKSSVAYETFNKSRTGKTFWTQCTLTPIYDELNNLDKLITIETDITSIKNANEKISEQNELIKSSLTYARTIQQAILPSHKEIEKFYDFFALYRPKDIVSGDIYWFAVVRELPTYIKTEYITFIASIDCTGHGVPGAFMSLISNRILNEIVFHREIYNPKVILKMLDRNIRMALRQEETKNIDGLDILLCRIDKKRNLKYNVIFAGALSSMFYFNSEKTEISRIKGDRVHIGGLLHAAKDMNFTNIKIVCKKNDVLYMPTDGYIDQNNKKMRKFGTPKFKKLLELIATQPFVQQKKVLTSTLDKWQAKEVQLDDITVIAIKFR